MMNYYEVATKIDVSSAGFIGIREDNLIYVDKTQLSTNLHSIKILGFFQDQDALVKAPLSIH